MPAIGVRLKNRRHQSKKSGSGRAIVIAAGLPGDSTVLFENAR
jgi:hypothetical protein